MMQPPNWSLPTSSPNLPWKQVWVANSPVSKKLHWAMCSIKVYKINNDFHLTFKELTWLCVWHDYLSVFPSTAEETSFKPVLNPSGQASIWSFHSTLLDPRTTMFLVRRPTSALASKTVPSGSVTDTPRWVYSSGLVRVRVLLSAETEAILLNSFSLWLCLSKQHILDN